MKPNEAIQRIKQHNEHHSKKERFAVHITEALNMAVDALEKQIPKKPFIPWDSISGAPYCPNCEEYVRGCDAYCDHCGQALDWSDTE